MPPMPLNKSFLPGRGDINTARTPNTNTTTAHPINTIMPLPSVRDAMSEGIPPSAGATSNRDEYLRESRHVQQRSTNSTNFNNKKFPPRAGDAREIPPKRCASYRGCQHTNTAHPKNTTNALKTNTNENITTSSHTKFQLVDLVLGGLRASPGSPR